MPKITDAMRARGGPAASGVGPEAMPPRRKLGDIRFDSFFQYAVNLAYVTGIEALLGNIPIQSDAHFLCVTTQYDVALTAVPAFNVSNLGVQPGLASGGFLCQITDGGTQRALQNIQVPASTLFGTAQRPYVWPFTHVFKANTSIQLLATGVAAAAVANVTARFVFSGFKVPLGSMPELNL